ncbi:chorismate mutase family protein [Agrobacterium vitis]|uniref:chorismate mutase n=2 Tax=Agrobacterium vitis TaxID=373 RepID=A0A6L6VHX9_AGRVI|nr:chorismate mutase family protein [Agrobacterium vitis]
MPMTNMSDFRQRIDDIDRKIIELLSERFTVVREVGLFKRQHGIPVMQPERVRSVLENRALQAEQAGLSPELVRQLWTLFIEEACRMEEAV